MTQANHLHDQEDVRHSAGNRIQLSWFHFRENPRIFVGVHLLFWMTVSRNIN
jgi:hypothetical protein